MNFAEQNRLDAVMAQVFDEAIKKLWAGELAKLPEDEVPADRLAEIQHSKFESGFANRLLIPNSYNISTIKDIVLLTIILILFTFCAIQILNNVLWKSLARLPFSLWNLPTDSSSTEKKRTKFHSALETRTGGTGTILTCASHS